MLRVFVLFFALLFCVGSVFGSHDLTPEEQEAIDAHLAEENPHDWYLHIEHDQTGEHSHDSTHNHNLTVKNNSPNTLIPTFTVKLTHTHNFTHEHPVVDCNGCEDYIDTSKYREKRRECFRNYRDANHADYRDRDALFACLDAHSARRKECRKHCNSSNAPVNPHLTKKPKPDKRTLATTWASLKTK